MVRIHRQKFHPLKGRLLKNGTCDKKREVEDGNTVGEIGRADFDSHRFA